MRKLFGHILTSLAWIVYLVVNVGVLLAMASLLVGVLYVAYQMFLTIASFGPEVWHGVGAVAGIGGLILVVTVAFTVSKMHLDKKFSHNKLYQKIDRFF